MKDKVVVITAGARGIDKVDGGMTKFMIYNDENIIAKNRKHKMGE